MDFSTDDIRIVPLPNAQDILTDVLRQGAQQLLAQAIDAETSFIVRLASANLWHPPILDRPASEGPRKQEIPDETYQIKTNTTLDGSKLFIRQVSKLIHLRFPSLRVRAEKKRTLWLCQARGSRRASLTAYRISPELELKAHFTDPRSTHVRTAVVGNTAGDLMEPPPLQRILPA
jgi:hypothetical protein